MFLNKFFLYKSIRETTLHNNKKLSKRLRLDADSDIIDRIKCDCNKWQVCFFDFTFQKVIPNFFIYDTRDHGLLDDDHFNDD